MTLFLARACNLTEVPFMSKVFFSQIFVPIHKEIHWCLAVINKKDQKFQYLDSLRGYDTKVMQLLVCFVAIFCPAFDMFIESLTTFFLVCVWVWRGHCCLSVLIFSATKTAISVLIDRVREYWKRNLSWCIRKSVHGTMKLMKTNVILSLVTS